MVGDNEKRAPQNLEKAFKMSAEKTERPVRAAMPPAASAPVRARRAVMPAETKSFDDDDYERRSRRRAKPQKPFRKLKLIAFIVASAWLFLAGVLVGRGSSPVSFDMDQLRNQLVTASARISERIAHTGDEGVDFYDTLGQTGVDTQITDPRNYRPEYAQLPPDNSLGTGDGGDAGEGLLDDGSLTADAGTNPETPESQPVENVYEGKILEPRVKPKTEYPAYVALKASGARVDAAAPQTAQTSQAAANQTSSGQTASNQGPQTLTPTQNKPPNRPQTQTVTAGGGQQQQTAATDAARGAFAVQVAAVRGEDEARALLNSLDQKGFKGWVEKTTVGEGTWYRVRVGPYTNRAVAEENLQRLTKIGIKSPMIVSN